MLWWLAEHKSRVLTIMTTNNDKILPKELYREGRIDEVMTFLGVPAGVGAARLRRERAADVRRHEGLGQGRHDAGRELRRQDGGREPSMCRRPS